MPSLASVRDLLLPGLNALVIKQNLKGLQAEIVLEGQQLTVKAHIPGGRVCSFGMSEEFIESGKYRSSFEFSVRALFNCVQKKERQAPNGKEAA